MKLLFICFGVLTLTSCKPHQANFDKWSKDAQHYREHNANKKLIPYLEDVYEGRD